MEVLLHFGCSLNSRPGGDTILIWACVTELGRKESQASHVSSYFQHITSSL